MQRYRIIRFIISGGTAAVVHLGIFLICMEVYDVWYLYATSIGFVGGVTTSFLLQKYWTFADTTTHLMVQQSVGYISLALVNLYLNGHIMYILVESYDIIPLLAQIIATICISVESFLVSSFIFKKRDPAVEPVLQDVAEE